VLDRATGKLVFMASQAGGMEIESGAAKTPEAIFKESIDPAIGLGAWQARKLAFALGLKPAQIQPSGRLFGKACTKLSLRPTPRSWRSIPLSPPPTTSSSHLDAKITFDDQRALSPPGRSSAARHGRRGPAGKWKPASTPLNYIKLDGSIACMVNGAGLAMATMDIIQYAGGSPANFLDVGGGATQEQIEHAFEILLADANVKAHPHQHFWEASCAWIAWLRAWWPRRAT